MIQRSTVIILVLGAFTSAPVAAHAQTAGNGLEKTDKGFKHAASGIDFVLPEKWQAYIETNKNYVDGGKFQPDKYQKASS